MALTAIKSIFALQHPFCFRFKLINTINSHDLITTCCCVPYVHVNTEITTDKTPTEVQSTKQHKFKRKCV